MFQGLSRWVWLGGMLLGLAGCSMTITNHDSIGSDLDLTVTQDGSVLLDEIVPYGETRTVNSRLFSPRKVSVHGVALADGLTQEIEFTPSMGVTTIEWIEGFWLNGVDMKGPQTRRKAAKRGR